MLPPGVSHNGALWGKNQLMRRDRLGSNIPMLDGTSNGRMVCQIAPYACSRVCRILCTVAEEDRVEGGVYAIGRMKG
jgi:hypothetical protein